MGREHDTLTDQAGKARVAARRAAAGLEVVQRAVGNAGMARLLGSPGGARALRRMTAGGAGRTLARWDWPWSKTPQLAPVEEVPIEHEFEVSPVIPKMEARAEREREGKHPPTPQKFEPGDHVWYYATLIQTSRASPPTSTYRATFGSRTRPGRPTTKATAWRSRSS